MKLKKSESELVGHWINKGNEVIEDETCKRIRYLIQEVLLKLGNDNSGWDVLYLDPEDLRLWELVYPNSELQGGGPPSLINIGEEAATQKYGDKVM